MSIIHQEIGSIWMDGEYVKWQDAKVHALMHTLHYGIGVFEGTRVYKTKNGSVIFRLQAHTDRLFRSTHILNMPLHITAKELSRVQEEVFRRNELEAGYIRVLVTYSCEHFGLHTHNALTPHVIVATWPWENYFDAEDEEEGTVNTIPERKGVKVRVSSYARNHVNSVMSKAKTSGNYVNSILALQEANASGCEEALMLDTQGLVAEGSSSNVFIVRNGVLCTPQATAILEGITRDTIMTLARDLGITVQERPITRDEVYIADEMFFTGTAAEVVGVSEVDGRHIGNGHLGPITKRLKQEFDAVLQGERNAHREWLTIL